MSPEQWRQVKEIASDIRDLSLGARPAAVEASCGSDSDLRREVDALLSALENTPETFLELGGWTASAKTGAIINDRYAIVRELARTPSNAVYLANDLQLMNKPVVLKTSIASGNLMRECQALAELRHPGIVSVLDMGECADLGKFIVLEYVSGGTLRQRVKDGALPLKLVRRLLGEMASALTAAHAAGILHRDLKPENVMLANESGVERAKLIDFGIARVQYPMAGATTTVAGGTLGYLAPEQLIGNAGQSSDLYSLAVIVYEMLTGVHPYVGNPRIDGRTAHPSEICRELPRTAGDVLLRALDYRPEHRPVDVKTFVEVFEAACDGKRSRRLPVFAAVFLACLVALGILVSKTVAELTPPLSKLSQIKRLTSPDVLSLDPAISRDGKWIAYASDQAGDGLLNIWVRQTVMGETRQLTHDLVGARDPDFSPEVSRIAYHSDYDGALYMIPIVGGRPRQIAVKGRRPRFSPNGKLIAYWDGDPGEADGTVYFMDASGGAATSMNSLRNAVTDPVWSDDSSRLLMWCYESGEGASEQMDLWVVSFESGAPTKTGVSAILREQGLRGLPPSQGFEPLSWVGDRVLFAARDAQGADLWEIVVSSKTGKVGGKAQRVTEQVARTRQAARAGGKLVFSTRDESRHIWDVPLNGTDRAQQITWAARQDGGPSISADGKRLAFSGDDAGGRRSVWAKDLGSGREVQLSRDLDVKLCPRLSRDGSTVVFSTEKEGKRTVWLTSAEAKAGAPKRLCGSCGLPQDWGLEGSEILSDAGYDSDYPGAGLFVLKVKMGARRFIPTPRYYIEPRLSPDGRWMSLLTFDQSIFVAPFNRTGDQEPEDNWIQITKDNARNNLAAWAPDGRTLYYLSDRDGFRCVWGQRLDPDTKQPRGEAFPVYHSHNARVSLGNAGHERATGLSAAKDKIVFSQGERKGAIWLADLN